MKTLFEDQYEVIRTLGFYQPFASLMFHGKVETRWVKKGKKPPFPLGKYLFYTTQSECSSFTLFDWCGPGVTLSIDHLLLEDETRKLNGYALGTGELIKVAPLTSDDLSFVKFEGEKDFSDKNGFITKKVQWGLHFKNVKRIEPFLWEQDGKKLGKQGTGFLPNQFLSKVK